MYNIPSLALIFLTISICTPISVTPALLIIKPNSGPPVFFYPWWNLKFNHPPPISDCPYLSIVHTYPDLTRPATRDAAAKHDVVHHIRTNGPAQFSRFRRLAPEKLKIAQGEFQHL